MHWWHVLQHWLAYHAGSLNEPGAAPGSAFWGGVASDLGELTLVGGLAAVYRKHNCHRHRCWRIGHFDFTDDKTSVTYRLCRKCHPAHSGKRLTLGRLSFIHARNQSAGED